MQIQWEKLKGKALYLTVFKHLLMFFYCKKFLSDKKTDSILEKSEWKYNTWSILR